MIFFKGVRDTLLYFFIPHSKNGFRAKLLQPTSLTVLAIFAVLLNLVGGDGRGKVLGYATDITVKKLFFLTNAKREKYGLKPLNYSKKLEEAAFLKAEDMFKKNYWSHYSPDGTPPWHFILKVGYDYEYAGENLAKNFLYSDAVVNAWMHSREHRENILNPQYTDVGFAIKNGVLQGEQTTLIVQMFGKPLRENEMMANVRNSKNNISNVSGDTNTGFDRYEMFFYLDKFFLSFLVILLIFDLVYATELSLVRASGKNLAHLLFLFFILLALSMITKGRVI